MKSAPLKTIADYFIGPDIHDLQRESHGGGITAVVAVIVLIIECLLLKWLFAGSLSFAFALLCHVAISFVLVLYARSLRKSGSENRFALLLAMSVAVTGPYGAAGIIITVLFYMFFTRRALPFATWFTTQDVTLTLVTGAMGVLAIYKHKTNLQRLLNGTESRVKFGRKEAVK